MEYANKITQNLKQHFIDSTAMLAVGHPVVAACETFVVGMSDDVSLTARLYATGFTYSGIGWAIGKGRDLSRKLFRIDETTSEKIQQFHDAMYISAVNLPISVGLYIASGETDIKKIAVGSAMSIAYGVILGAPIGCSIDYYRDLTGFKECNRKSYPNFVKKMKPNWKKVLAIGLTAASIGALAAVYKATPDKLEFHHKSNVKTTQNLNVECDSERYLVELLKTPKSGSMDRHKFMLS